MGPSFSRRLILERLLSPTGTEFKDEPCSVADGEGAPPVSYPCPHGHSQVTGSWCKFLATEACPPAGNTPGSILCPIIASGAGRGVGETNLWPLLHSALVSLSRPELWSPTAVASSPAAPALPASPCPSPFPASPLRFFGITCQVNADTDFLI